MVWLSLAKQCDVALHIVNIFHTFERIPNKIKQELEIAKQIEANGWTAIIIQLLDDYKSQAKNSGIKVAKRKKARRKWSCRNIAHSRRRKGGYYSSWESRHQ
jgi:hypothetical protein